MQRIYVPAEGERMGLLVAGEWQECETMLFDKDIDDDNQFEEVIREKNPARYAQLSGMVANQSPAYWTIFSFTAWDVYEVES